MTDLLAAISFDHPQRLWLLAVIPVMILLSWRALACLEPRQRICAIVARCVVVALLVLCLAGVQSVRVNENLTVIFLLDRSNSVPEPLHEQQESFIYDVSRRAPPGDRVGVITFDGLSYVEQLPMRGGVFIETLPETTMPDRTDMTGAMRMAMALFPHDTAKRMVVLSDGNNNVGDVLAEVQAAAANHVGVDVVPLYYRHSQEVYVEKLVAPANVKDGDLVPLRGTIQARGPVSGTLHLDHNGQPIPLPPDQARIRLQPGSNPVGMKVPVHGSGPHRFNLLFVPDRDSADTVVENNRGTAYTFVGGGERVLFLSTSLEEDLELITALKKEKLDLTATHIEQAADLDITQFMSFSSIVLSNVGADWFTDEQQQHLASYVRDMGGGLIMTGGDEAFGAGGWIGTPVEEVMPVDFEIKHRQVVPRGALVIVMHSCEMPRGNYWGKLVAKKALDTISSKDYFGLIEYNHMIGEAWGVPLEVASNKPAIKRAIDNMSNGDMPDFDTTLVMAVDSLMERRDAAQRHIIVISDGDASAASRSVLNRMVDNKITCSTVAIGYGYHAQGQELKRIATTTGGRFHPARNPKKLPQIFVKESKMVRRPLLIEQPFTPRLHYAMSDLWAGFPLDMEIPALGGLVMTSPKPAGLIEMPLVRHTSDGDDPLLAHWQIGLGKTVAFTSGYWRHWGQEWVDWPNFSKLFAQVVRWTLGQGEQGKYDLGVRVEGTRGRIVVNALDEQGDFINMLDLTARVNRPAGLGVEQIRLKQVGPGRYEGEFDVDVTGQFVVGLGLGDRVVGRTGVSVPYSPEYRQLQANEALLQEMVDRSGGEMVDMDPEQADIFRHDLQPTRSRRPVWEWVLAWLLLPMFLFDVAVRRLASIVAMSVLVEALLVIVLLFGAGLAYVGGLRGVMVVLGVLLLAEVIGWAIRFRSIRPTIDYLTATVTALSGAGHSSASSLQQLKGTRERVREERTAGGEKSSTLKPLKGPKAAVAARRGRRFDVGESQAAEPVGDLREQLGGPPPAAPRSASEQAESDEQAAGEMTSRLLKARKRARKEFDAEDEQSKGEE